jgi:hypothetical protein
MVVWMAVSGAWAGEERAPRSAIFVPECACIRLEYAAADPTEVVEIPRSSVVALVVEPGPDDLFDISLRTSSGADQLIYRAPCLFARDFGSRFGGRLGLPMLGPAVDTMCPDKVGPAAHAWAAAKAPESLADVDAHDRRGEARLDVQRGLSSQRPLLAACFVREARTGEGTFRLALDVAGAATSARIVESTGSAKVDDCISKGLLGAPAAVSDRRGRAWVDVGFHR